MVDLPQENDKTVSNSEMEHPVEKSAEKGIVDEVTDEFEEREEGEDVEQIVGENDKYEEDSDNDDGEFYENEEYDEEEGEEKEEEVEAGSGLLKGNIDGKYSRKSDAADKDDETTEQNDKADSGDSGDELPRYSNNGGNEAFPTTLESSRSGSGIMIPPGMKLSSALAKTSTSLKRPHDDSEDVRPTKHVSFTTQEPQTFAYYKDTKRANYSNQSNNSNDAEPVSNPASRHNNARHHDGGGRGGDHYRPERSGRHDRHDKADRYESGPGRVSSEFTVPTDMVGLIIGRAGESLKQIEQASDSNIQFAPGTCRLLFFDFVETCGRTAA